MQRWLMLFGGMSAASVLVGCASPMDEWANWEPGAGTRDAQAIRRPLRTPAERCPPPTQGVDLGESVEVERLVRLALERSPEIERAYQRYRAAAARVPQVEALPDPSVSLGVFLDEIETRTGAQQARIGVRQGIPWPGLLRARGDAASRMALARLEAFEGVRLRVRRQVIERASELAYLDAATAITRENLDLLASFEDVVRARYRVGTGSHPDLVRVQVSLGQLEDRLRQLRDMRPALVGEVNEVLHREADAPIGVIVMADADGALPEAADLIARAKERNADLRVLEQREREARARQEVARLESMPDFTLGVDYIITDEAQNPSVSESGDDPIMLMLGISLPVWLDKERARRQEALAQRLAVAGERASTEDRIAAQITRAHFATRDARRRIELYRDTLIPKAEESLRASLGAFRTGQASFLDLLDAERTLLEFQIALERARADERSARARLDELMGEPIEATDTMPTDTTTEDMR